MILCGKQLFAAVLLLGVFLQLTICLFLSRAAVPVRSPGFIVAGLIAYQRVRQPVAGTVVATVVVTMLSRVVLLNLLPQT